MWPRWNFGNCDSTEVEFRNFWFHRGGLSDFDFWPEKKNPSFLNPAGIFDPPNFWPPYFWPPGFLIPRKFWPRNGHGFSPEFCEVPGYSSASKILNLFTKPGKFNQNFTKYRVYANKWHSNRGPSRERQAQPCPRCNSFLKKLQKSWHGRFFHTFSQITLSIAQREHPTPATPPTGRFVTMNIREYTWNHGPAPGKQVTPSTQRGGDPARRLRTSTQRTRFEGMLATLNGFGF